MATGNPSQNIPPVVTSVADMAGSIAVAQQPMSTADQHPMSTAAQQPMPIAAQQLMPSAAQQPGPSASIPVGGMAQQPLYTQTTSNPFSYGMPPVTIGSMGNFFANNMVSSMPMSSGNPSSNFRPFQFGNAHISLSNPTLGGAFAQTGAQVGSIPMSRGGFILQPFAQFGSIAGVDTNFIPQIDSSFLNPSVSGGKMFGSNPYYSSNQQMQFQPYFPRTNILSINAYGGGSNPYHFQQN